MGLRTSEAPCPICGGLLDEHDGVDGPEAVPVAGDVGLCLYCSTPIVFVTLTPLSVRLMTEEERVIWQGHPMRVGAEALLRALQAEEGGAAYGTRH